MRWPKPIDKSQAAAIAKATARQHDQSNRDRSVALIPSASDIPELSGQTAATGFLAKPAKQLS